MTQTFVNSQGNYSDTFVVPEDSRYNQTYITLTPIIIRKTNNKFDFNNEYDSNIMISPIF